MRQLDLTDLDETINRTEIVLRVSRECGFAEAVALVEADIVKSILPDTALLMAFANGKNRSAIATRYRRLAKLLVG